LLAEHRFDRGGDFTDLFRFHRKYYDVDGAHVSRIRGGYRRLHESLSAWRRDAKALAANGRQVITARNERDFLPGLNEPGAKVSADAANSVNRYSHAGRLSASWP
jgi:hypothetical protein